MNLIIAACLCVIMISGGIIGTFVFPGYRHWFDGIIGGGILLGFLILPHLKQQRKNKNNRKFR